MRWEDESYVRVYTRKTADYLGLSWQAKAVLPLMLMEADKAGIVRVRAGARRVQLIAGLIGLPFEVTEPGLSDLLEDGCILEVESGYVFPNFVEAQSAAQSDKQRKAEQRARDRDIAAARPILEKITGTVTKRDEPSQNVTESHERSQAVTSGHSLHFNSVQFSSEKPPNPLSGAGAPGTSAPVIPIQKPPPAPDDWADRMDAIFLAATKRPAAQTEHQRRTGLDALMRIPHYTPEEGLRRWRIALSPAGKLRKSVATWKGLAEHWEHFAEEPAATSPAASLKAPVRAETQRHGDVPRIVHEF